MSGWHLCTDKSCKFASLQSDNTSTIFAKDYDGYNAAPRTLLQFKRTQKLSGTKSVIVHGEMFTIPKGFLEIDQDFSVLSPRLFNFEDSANSCDKIWSLELPDSINASADLVVKVYNYGEVSS